MTEPEHVMPEQPLPDQPLPERQAGRVARVLAEWRTLAILGAPILIAQLAQMATGVIDTIMAGRVSAEDLAAVGIGSSLWVPLFLLFGGTLNALQPIISGHHGAQTPTRIMPMTWQGIYVALAATLIMSGLLLNVSPVLEALRLDATTAAIAQGYLNGVAWGVPAMLLLMALRGLTDGLGHTRVFMVFSLLAAAFNLPLNYVFIYGKFGLPAMGGVGCGWATAISAWIALLSLMAYLHWSRTYQRFHLVDHWAAPNWPDIWHLLYLGAPIGFTIFVEVSVFSVVALFLAPLGPVIIAGHQIVLNLVSLVFMVPLSLGMALTLRVSFLLGAHEPETARLLARSALLLALGIALVYVPVLLMSRGLLVGLYTHDSQVQAVASGLLLFGAIFQIADVLQVTAISALRGYRDTRVPMFIMLFAFWGICLPLGYGLTFTDWLGEPRGAAGFWMALTVGLALASILLMIRLLNLQDYKLQQKPPASA